MNSRLPYLLNKYLKKSCSAEELTEFYALAALPENELEFDHLLEHALDLTTEDQHLAPGKETEFIQNILNYQDADPNETPVSPLQTQTKIRPNYKQWLAVAAAVLILFSAGFYFFNTYWNTNEVRVSQLTGTKSIPPGGNRAVLTLSNGKTIDLSAEKTGLVIDGSNISYSEGGSVAAIKSESPQVEHTLTTPRAGQYQLNLSDGTKVWLNAASSITFPAAFAANSPRIVTLQGEAYFEVAKSKAHASFIVNTTKQVVEVLGTHFNIHAYGDERYTKTTLLEGSVKVISSQFAKELILEPGEQSILTRTQLVQEKVDAQQSIDWKNGKFIFKNETLEDILRKISRWYDVNIVYESGVSRNETFTGTVSRFDEVQKVLRRLELTGVVNFKIHDRTITVIK